MCGISAIIKMSDREITPNDLSKMNDVIAHRGPDGDGIFIDGNVGLGHRRLSIIDLSERGSQPMTSDFGHTITFNGEIFNYLELRKRLETKGYSFRTATDTEVILVAYQAWGSACVDFFNGQWSFIIYDRARKTLFCSRDRFGIKPFYYLNHQGSFYVGSEIRQLLPFLNTIQANKKVLLDYLVLGMVEHSDETFFSDIKKLPPAHNLIFDLAKNSYSIQPYYQIALRPELESASLQEVVKEYLSVATRSVDLRLRADVKVGTCLSGGLDSSFVASLASKLNARSEAPKFTAITAQSTLKHQDETHFARKMVEFCDLDWHLVTPSEHYFQDYLESVIRTQEEPFTTPSIFMQYSVMEKSKAIGCPVLLDGQGGDETLLGYERYFVPFLRGIPLQKRPKYILSITKRSKWNLTDLILHYVYFSNFHVRRFRLQQKFQFLKESAFEMVSWDLLQKQQQLGSSLTDLQKMELGVTCLPQLLRYEDKNSMAHSIEARLPLIDYKLVETALSISSHFKIIDGWSKSILRKASKRYLPDAVRYRTHKLGFEAPEKQWLSDRHMFEASIRRSKSLNDLITKEKYNYPVANTWRLYNIARWEEIFNVAGFK